METIVTNFICTLELKTGVHRTVKVEATDVVSAIACVEKSAVKRVSNAKKKTPWVCMVVDTITGQKYGIQRRGWAPEPFRTLETYFFELEPAVQNLGCSLNLDNVLDAAAAAVSEEQLDFGYDPMEWGEDDTGNIYGLSIEPNGTLETHGLVGKSFLVGLRHVKPRSKSKQRGN